ncbi:Ras family GTPase [Fadolivirus algeromassiliense]|jgi:small GTP-binding protein|uniref:Ras family GTPase n=1 Tax=Fadolivirus FV1/VV64 TaxID=3070911 RepID=A0A7D3UV34_9VIRU|nr:Ras family GTPase [Fadolivirus algeromassiliense]QKF93634.1 Ras family GTPase [Fadolivirus FV1/VV64]
MGYVIKCILIGKSGVGKTSIALKYFEDKFYSGDDSITTIGVDFHVKKIIIDKDEYKIQVWDTAGQERFRSIVKTYFKSANCVIFCFSLIDYESFIELNKIIDEFDTEIDKPTNRILVGTFYDKKKSIIIEDYQIEDLMKRKNLHHYFNVSSFDNTGLNELFETVIKSSVKLHKENVIQLRKHIEEEFNIEDNKKQWNTKDCCIII